MEFGLSFGIAGSHLAAGSSIGSNPNFLTASARSAARETSHRPSPPPSIPGSRNTTVETDATCELGWSLGENLLKQRESGVSNNYGMFRFRLAPGVCLSAAGPADEPHAIPVRSRDHVDTDQACIVRSRRAAANRAAARLSTASPSSMTSSATMRPKAS